MITHRFSDVLIIRVLPELNKKQPFWPSSILRNHLSHGIRHVLLDLHGCVFLSRTERKWLREMYDYLNGFRFTVIFTGNEKLCDRDHWLLNKMYCANNRQAFNALGYKFKKIQRIAWRVVVLNHDLLSDPGYLTKVSSSRYQGIVLDLQRVRSFNSRGISWMIEKMWVCKRKGVRFAVCNCSETLMGILKTIGFTKAVQVYEKLSDVTEANAYAHAS